MDLSIQVQDTIINIRVAGLMKTPNGFLFEKHKNGYIFALGGRVKLGETSRATMIRETLEEIGTEVKQFTLCSVIENFFTNGNQKTQEICFVYKIDEVFAGIVPPEFIEISLEDIDKYDIKPKRIVDILKSKENSFKHIIIKE